MKKNLLLGLCFGLTVLANAQQKKAETAPIAAATPKAEEKPQVSSSRVLNPDMSVITNGEVMIKGQKVPYKTTAGTIPVWDEAGKIIASCFYTYYERSDVKDKASRPIIFSFNGGPGLARRPIVLPGP
jgi:carboxypeptidase C (cathepsin A)